LALAAIYLSRVGVVGSIFGAAVAALNVGAGPCWGKTCGDVLEAMARIAP